MMPERDVLIVGAGPAGLACAAALADRGITSVVLEQAGHVAAAWRKHYDRLHLHTDKAHSALPGLPMPKAYPKYPSRDQVIEYLESYVDHNEISVELGERVTELRRSPDGWNVSTEASVWKARFVIMATGIAASPYSPDLPGLDSFAGEVMHSSGYTNAAAFQGRRVLVIGFGNSGGEIACDLAENGVDTALSVRGPVNVLPREIFGVSALSWAIAEAWMPPWLADRVSAPLIRWALGDIRRLGLEKSKKGPTAQVVEDGRVPLIDAGALDCLRRDEIVLRQGVDSVEGGRVRFVDGSSAQVDAIICATGYRPDLRELLPDAADLLDRHGHPLESGSRSGRGGLYFCNYHLARTGQLREAGIQAGIIADDIDAERLRNPADIPPEFRARRVRAVTPQGDSAVSAANETEQPLPKLHLTR